MRNLDQILDDILSEFDRAIKQEQLLLETVLNELSSSTNPEQKKSVKTRQVYKYKILDENNQYIKPIYVRQKFDATFSQHFTWCVQMYVNLLNSKHETDRMSSAAVFITELHQHSLAKDIMVGANRLLIAETFSKSVKDADALGPVLSKLAIPGVKKCLVYAEYEDIKKRKPVSQKLFDLSDEVLHFLGSFTRPLIATGILNNTSSVQWKGLERIYDDGSLESTAIITVDEKVSKPLRSTCIALGLNSCKLIDKEGKGKKFLKIDLKEVAQVIENLRRTRTGMGT